MLNNGSQVTYIYQKTSESLLVQGNLLLGNRRIAGAISLLMYPTRTPDTNNKLIDVPRPLMPPLIQNTAIISSQPRSTLVAGSYALRQKSQQVATIMNKLASLKDLLYDSLNDGLTTEEYGNIYQNLSQILASLPSPITVAAAKQPRSQVQQPHTWLPSISQVISGNEQYELQQQSFIVMSNDTYKRSYTSPPLSYTVVPKSVFPETASITKPVQGNIKGQNVCKVCGRECRRPSTLKTHILTHTGQRPFLCRYPGCNKSFNVRSNMLRHERLHDRSSDIDSAKTPEISTAVTTPAR